MARVSESRPVLSNLKKRRLDQPFFEGMRIRLAL